MKARVLSKLSDFLSGEASELADEHEDRYLTFLEKVGTFEFMRNVSFLTSPKKTERRTKNAKGAIQGRTT